MFSGIAKRIRFPLLLSLVFFGVAVSGVLAVDRNVGAGQDFTTITEALAAAVAGDDRVVVFGGAYNERIDWNKAVDVIEADGETAVLTIDDTVAADSGSFWIDVTFGGEESATWDGVDLLYDSVNYSRIVLKRDSDDSEVTFQSITVRDTLTASGHPRIFTAEAGAMNLRDVDIDMSSIFQAPIPDDEGNFFQIGCENGILATGITQLACENVNCALTGGSALVILGVDTIVTWNGGTLNRKTTGFTSFLTDITDGTSIFTGVHFTAGCDTPRGILTRFGDAEIQAPATVECIACTFNGEIAWRTVSFEKTTNARFINCCFPHDVTTMTQNERDCQVFGEERCQGAFFCSQTGFVNPPFAVHFDRSSQGGGFNWELEFTHCTFAATDAVAPFGNAMEAGVNVASGIQDASRDPRNIIELVVDNCLFDIPGSEVGGVARKPNTPGGAQIDVLASTNLVYTDDTPPLQADLLESDDAGTILNQDPKLQDDFCHIESTSAAIDAGMAVGVATDIDGEDRPIGEGVELGADETEGLTLPQFIRGDHDASGLVDLTDSLNTLGFLFIGTTPPVCLDASDFDNSAMVDISDPLNGLTFLFLGTVQPPPPGVEQCGEDPADVVLEGAVQGLPEQPAISLGCDCYDCENPTSCQNI